MSVEAVVGGAGPGSGWWPKPVAHPDPATSAHYQLVGPLGQLGRSHASLPKKSFLSPRQHHRLPVDALWHPKVLELDMLSPGEASPIGTTGLGAGVPNALALNLRGVHDCCKQLSIIPGRIDLTAAVYNHLQFDRAHDGKGHD